MSEDRYTGWCTAIFRILDASYATDTAIIEAINHYMKQRRTRRGY